MSTTPSKVAPGTMYEPLAWQQIAAWKETARKRRETAPREADVHGGWRREENKKKRKKKKKKKKRRRQSRKTKAARVASAGCNNLLIVYQMSPAPSKVVPGTMYEPLAWQQTAAWKETGWKRGEIAPREADVGVGLGVGIGGGSK